MNIFEQAPEFIEWDNRKDREVNRVTAESTYNRLSVQIPEWLIKGGTILDLGSCLGAAGHMALTNGATHYTGVEIQDIYVKQSNEILAKYWPTEKFTIIQQNLEDFLDYAIANNIQYDHVIASGVLYAFLNIISILEKISKVGRLTVIIDTIYVPNKSDKGIITIRPDMPMNYSEGAKTFTGLAASLNMKALDMLMKSNSFHRTEDRIIPPITKGSHDGYADLVRHGMGHLAPVRYMVRYYRAADATKKLIDKIIANDTKEIVDFYKVVDLHKTGQEMAWKFDAGVAARFQQEAEQHIPDYHRVIDMCLEIATNEIDTAANIIDVGSALGYTVDKFIAAGFLNTFGVDNSESMVSQSLHADRVILGDTLPDSLYKMILINWTLHFVVDKIAYLTDVYNKLEQGGIVIISDKTAQSKHVKDMYYKFKEDNGVSLSYIKEKEAALVGIMHTMPADWYLTQLKEIGFQRVEILNARYGFVTFVCRK